jgi:hypothetical protein
MHDFSTWLPSAIACTARQRLGFGTRARQRQRPRLRMARGTTASISAARDGSRSPRASPPGPRRRADVAAMNAVVLERGQRGRRGSFICIQPFPTVAV